MIAILLIKAMKTLVFISQKDTSDINLANLCASLADRQLNCQILNVDSAVEPIEVKTYDIVSTPSVVVARDDGAANKIWRHRIPTAEEVSYAYGYI
jgi:hypothetical protein